MTTKLRHAKFILCLATVATAAFSTTGCSTETLEEAAEVTNEATDGVDEGQYANGGQTDRISSD